MAAQWLSKLVNGLTLGRVKYGWYTTAWRSSQSPIMVGGCSRSGTTLMYSIIGSHSRIYLALETGLLTGNRDCAHLARRFELPEAQVRSLYRRACCSAEFTERLIRTAGDQHKPGARWGDKSPVNIRAIDHIFHRFPNVRFVHMIRDGRDVACSLRTHPPAFIKGPREGEEIINDWGQCAARWIDWTARGMKWRDDPRYHEVRYEDLVADPEATIRRLLAFLEVPWEDDLLERCRKVRVKTHPGLAQQINASAIERWRRDMTPEARAHFRGRGAELLRTLGYAQDDRWIDEPAYVDAQPAGQAT